MIDVLNNPVFLVFAFLTITGVVASLAHAWQKVKESEVEAQLKNEMIQRGMSADDIKKVIEASPARARWRDKAKVPPDEASALRK
jgi:hypothetical protein